MTVREFMKKHDVTRRTVYRWIESEKIQATKVDDKWDIHGVTDVRTDDTFDNDTECNDDQQIELELRDRIEKQQAEIKYLREELSQTNKSLADANLRLDEAQKRYDSAQERHDEAQQQSNMIIMQLTKQLEQKTLALEDKSQIIEDMQNRSLWRRLKMAFGFTP